jgi:hypothetical protein
VPDFRSRNQQAGRHGAAGGDDIHLPLGQRERGAAPALAASNISPMRRPMTTARSAGAGSRQYPSDVWADDAKSFTATRCRRTSPAATAPIAWCAPATSTLRRLEMPAWLGRAHYWPSPCLRKIGPANPVYNFTRLTWLQSRTSPA